MTLSKTKYNKVCQSKSLLHEYVLSIEHTGILTLFKPKVLVKYYYLKGVPMVHEVQKRSRYDNSIWQTGRTEESKEIKKLKLVHFSFLLKAGFIDQRQYIFYLRFLSVKNRIRKLKYLKIKKELGEHSTVFILRGKMYKRNDVLNKCVKLGN